MLTPNIVNVATITGVTTFHAGIAVTTGGKGTAGITTVVSNAAASGKVLKINSLSAAAIGSTTGVTLQYLMISIMLLLKYSLDCNDCICSNFLIIGSN